MTYGTVKMSKRARRIEPGDECAVCIEALTQVDRVVRPFRCSHFICGGCDAELFRRADDRCPTCRAARTELSMRPRDAGANTQRAATMQTRREAEARERTSATTIFFPSQAFAILSSGASGLFSGSDVDSDVDSDSESLLGADPDDLDGLDDDAVAASIAAQNAIQEGPLGRLVHALRDPTQGSIIEFRQLADATHGVYRIQRRR